MSDPVRVFVGTDRSQLLAVKVLEHSIQRHTDLSVEVTPMCDLDIPKPMDPRQGQRTGFSFSRFCIPELCGYKGKAIYMDADMLVFKDIAELWNHPLDSGSVVIQEDLKGAQTLKRKGIQTSGRRIKQCAVMLLDCANLQWSIQEIVHGLDEKKYTYENLMYELCILDEDQARYSLPFEWNSLEHYDQQTRLIHYTDMNHQPWVSPFNQWDFLWLNEVNMMLENGQLTWSELQNEIDLGHFRPSLVMDLKYRARVPRHSLMPWRLFLLAVDKSNQYVKHAQVNEFQRVRKKAIKEYVGQNRG